MVNESIIGNTIRVATLAALLAMPGILEAADIVKIINANPEYANVVRVLDTISEERYDGWSQATIANVISRTLFSEGSGEVAKDKRSLDYIATIIYNRAKGQVENLPKVCLKKWQFSCWNKISSKDRTADGYTEIFGFPNKIKENQTTINIWKQCMTIATHMIDGKFKPVNNYMTMYYNPKLSNPSWADKMVNTEKVGSHIFGSIDKHSNSKSTKIIRYTIKSGDNLFNIAKKYKTSVNNIIKLNKLKNKNDLSIGQTLKIKTAK